jgi:hypothetical protein
VFISNIHVYHSLTLQARLGVKWKVPSLGCKHSTRVEVTNTLAYTTTLISAIKMFYCSGPCTCYSFSDATTIIKTILSKMTLSITTLSITTLSIITLSLKVFCHTRNAKRHYAESQYAKCHAECHYAKHHILNMQCQASLCLMALCQVLLF